MKATSKYFLFIIKLFVRSIFNWSSVSVHKVGTVSVFCELKPAQQKTEHGDPT